MFLSKDDYFLMLVLNKDDYSLIADALESKYGPANGPMPCGGNHEVFGLMVKLGVMYQQSGNFQAHRVEASAEAANAISEP